MFIRFMKGLYGILSSKAFLLWMIGGWILYYVISAIWLREAFGAFVAGIRENLFMQIPFVLFLLSGYLNLIRDKGCFSEKQDTLYCLDVPVRWHASLFYRFFHECHHAGIGSAYNR